MLLFLQSTLGAQLVYQPALDFFIVLGSRLFSLADEVDRIAVELGIKRKPSHAHSNIAAGTITSNFDGKQKHHTTIGENAFIGCDTILVAPVTVGENAYTGAGAVITHDVPANSLVVGVPARVKRMLSPEKHETDSSRDDAHEEQKSNKKE